MIARTRKTAAHRAEATPQVGKRRQRLFLFEDDGAGDVKIIGYVEELPATEDSPGFPALIDRTKIRSLVAPADREGAFRWGRYHAQIQLPSLNSPSDDIWDSSVVYTIGEHLADRDIKPDTTRIRYTQQPAALVRFYAAAGYFIQKFELDTSVPIDVTLIAGVSTDYYMEVNEGADVVAMFKGENLDGDHYFRYDTVENRLNVDSVTINPQAHYAAQGIITNLPRGKIKDVLAEYEADILVIDIGNFTTDVAVIKYDHKGMYADIYFSVTKGVGQIRNRIAQHALAIFRQRISQQYIDDTIDPTSPSYGYIRNPVRGKPAADVRVMLQEILRSEWSAIFTEISLKLKDQIYQYCIVVTGGGGIIMNDVILTTIVEPATGLLFSDHPAAAITGSEWTVVEGMLNEIPHILAFYLDHVPAIIEREQQERIDELTPQRGLRTILG